MRYIEQILQPGEKLLYSGTIHWVIYIPAIVLSLIALALLMLVVRVTQTEDTSV